MSANDHWIYQGRQSHGWFGNGTAPKDDDDPAGTNGLFRPSNASERVDAAAHVLVAGVPRNERGRWSFAASDIGRDRLKTAVAAWYGASGLSRDAFRAKFLDLYTGDETVDHLRGAAQGLIKARGHDDLAGQPRSFPQPPGKLAPIVGRTSSEMQQGRPRKQSAKVLFPRSPNSTMLVW